MKQMLVFVMLVLVGCRWVKDANDTVYDEFKASSVLAKYSWFKDASAHLDARAADIEVAEGRLKALEKQYEGVARRDWARTDAEQSSIWQQEVAGLKMGFNNLAAQYNARMSKENYRFCNEGELPKGATKVLPREYKSYITN